MADQTLSTGVHGGHLLAPEHASEDVRSSRAVLRCSREPYCSGDHIS